MISLERCLLVLAVSCCLTRVDAALAQATSSIKCSNGTTLTLSVPGGSCIATGQQADCKNDRGDSASARCDIGSCVSTGDGSCSKARTAPVGSKPTKPTPIAINPTTGSGTKPPASGKGAKAGGAPPTSVGAKQGPSGGSGETLEAQPSGSGGGGRH